MSSHIQRLVLWSVQWAECRPVCCSVSCPVLRPSQQGSCSRNLHLRILVPISESRRPVPVRKSVYGTNQFSWHLLKLTGRKRFNTCRWITTAGTPRSLKQSTFHD